MSMSCMVIQSRLGASFAHELTGDVDGELVGAARAAGVRYEIVDGELEHISSCCSSNSLPPMCGCVERRFVVVAEQVAVVAGCAGRQAAVSRCFGKDDPRASAGPVARDASLSPMRLKPLLGATTQASFGGPLQIFAEVFKDRGIVRVGRRRSC